MCSRFTSGRKGLSPEDQRLEDEFVVAFQGLPRREISPRDSAVVLARGKGGILRPVTMRWGFERSFGLVFNTRSEELRKAMWDESDRKRRCAVPMEAFYEWQGKGRWRRKYRFGSVSPELDLWAAGLWEQSEPGELVFSILTKPAPDWMEPIHDRCPLLLQPGEVVPYLDQALDVRRAAEVPLTHLIEDENPTMRLPGFD